MENGQTNLFEQFKVMIQAPDPSRRLEVLQTRLVASRNPVISRLTGARR
jgi:hypothetical protein